MTRFLAGVLAGLVWAAFQDGGGFARETEGPVYRVDYLDGLVGDSDRWGPRPPPVRDRVERER